MAGELRASITTQLTNGSLVDPSLTSSSSITQTTALFDACVCSVTTSEGDIAFPSVSTLGWMRIRNLDGTNFVKYGPKSAGSMVVFGKLKAGEEAWLRLMTGITLRMVADTATCKVQIRIYND